MGVKRTSAFAAHTSAFSAVQPSGTDNAKVVAAKMRELPVNDFFAKGGELRADGRLVHDMYLVQVKPPEESRQPWDYYKILSIIPGDKAFRPLAEGQAFSLQHKAVDEKFDLKCSVTARGLVLMD
jgi:branched-chain amino acid transport system substrate-binding protein